MIPFLSLKSVTDQYLDEIHEAVRRVIDSGWYLQGQENAAFEQEYAQYIGTNYCVGCANGLDALIWIIRAYKELGTFKEGDEILVPANTYIATILAITENGLKAVLVEPRLDTLEIDDTILEQHLTDRTKAVMIVHLYGRCAYTDKIGAFCQKHNLKLFEDNAQAHGCSFSTTLHPSTFQHPTSNIQHSTSNIKHQTSNFKLQTSNIKLQTSNIKHQTSNFKLHTGALGAAAAHSFYPGKNMGALGDAGCVTTNDPEVADCIRSLGNYGSAKKYVFQYCGRNSRMDEIQAAILRVKLAHLEEANARRRAVAALYYDGLADCGTVTLPVRLPDGQNAYHLFPILCAQRDVLQTHLKEQGVQTLIHYPIPPHRQACYQQARTEGLLVLPKDGLQVTEQIHAQELSLPIGPTITDDEVRTVIVAIKSFRS